MNNFENIYQDNYPKMFGVALKMTDDRDAVCDIIQDVFISFYQKLENGNEIKQAKSWLMRATINKCIDHSKRAKKYTKIEAIDPIPTQESELDKQESLLIKTALSKLKSNERTLALLYSEGLSYKEISEITGIKLSSVGKTLSRTLKKLDKILKTMNHEMFE